MVVVHGTRTNLAINKKCDAYYDMKIYHRYARQILIRHIIGLIRYLKWPMAT